MEKGPLVFNNHRIIGVFLDFIFKLKNDIPGNTMLQIKF